MTRGPAPTPTVIKALRGSRRIDKKRIEPDYESLKVLPPAIVKGKALEEWHRLAPSLERMGLLTEADLAVFTMYCNAWGDYISIREKINKLDNWTIETDKGNLQQHPLIWDMNKAEEKAIKYAQQFGFTPASRTRVEATTGKAEDSGSMFTGE